MLSGCAVSETEIVAGAASVQWWRVVLDEAHMIANPKVIL